jgi:hypothetical protein
MRDLARRVALVARLAGMRRGLILWVALLTPGCVVGYRDVPDSPGQVYIVGQYLTLERCQRDPKVDRCERPFEHSFGGLSGVSGSVTWQVVDMKAGGDAHSSWSSFVLVLRETNGSAITFTRIAKYLGQGSGGHDLGLWSLQANGELRLPFASRRFCGGATCSVASPPTWGIVLTGKDERDRDVRVAIQIRLPSDLH